MINLADKVRYGSLVKTHGLQGELILESKIIDDTKNDLMELVFIIIDGKPVPFFLEYIENKTNETYLLKFDTINSSEKAKEVIGCEVFGLEKFTHSDNENSLYQFINFTVLNQDKIKIGTIVEIIDLNQNLLFKIDGITEHLIPAHADFIISTNKRKKEIYLNIPEGLIDLNTTND